MGIMDKVSKEDMNNARIERERQMNPPAAEPGMADDWGFDDASTFAGGEGMGGGDAWGSSFGGFGGGAGGAGSVGGGSDPFGGGANLFGGGASTPFGGGSAWGGFGSFDTGQSAWGQPQGQQGQSSKIEDALWDTAKGVMKGFFTFASEFVNSFKSMNTLSYMVMGRTQLIISIVAFLSGCLFLIFASTKSLGLSLIVSGLASGGIGLMIFMSCYEKVSANPEAFQPESQPDAFGDAQADPFAQPDSFSDPFGGGGSDDGWGTESDGWGEELDSFGDEEEPFEDDFEEEESFDTSFSASEWGSSEELEFSALGGTGYSPLSDADQDKILSQVQEGNKLLTRQYLYENIVSMYPYIRRDYNKVREITGAEFDAWDAVVQQSANILKPKGSDVEMPYLIKAEERLFFYRLVVKRVPWIKNVNQFVTEITNIYSFDETTARLNDLVYGFGVQVGNNINITIMKGETAMVSVRDLYQNISKEILNLDNMIPVVFGVDDKGNEIWRDIKNIESLLVTGMPRSGKTWLVLSMLAQMMTFLSPSELHFYICDPKEGISDFKKIKVPHVRKFVSDDEDIIRTLRHVVRVEGARRTKVLADAGCVNIFDYNKANPDKKMPLLYVIIDEIVSLSERMDKETKDEFQGLIMELVSRLPALGIRIIMIPHLVKNEFIKKSITALITCRISVRGSAEHIEDTLGVRKFEHSLVHPGDMAVSFKSGEAQFVHAAVLAKTNDETAAIFDFLFKFWSKVDPDSLKGSYYEASLNEMASAEVTRPKTDISFASVNEASTKTTGRVRLTDQERSELLAELQGDGLDLLDD